MSITFVFTCANSAKDRQLVQESLLSHIDDELIKLSNDEEGGEWAIERRRRPCICHWRCGEIDWICRRKNDIACAIPPCELYLPNECPAWERLTEDQRDFIEIINEVSADKKLFPDEEARINTTHIEDQRRQQDIDKNGELSPFHLHNTKNRAAVIRLEGMGGTGKTEVMKYIENHTRGLVQFATVKHVLLGAFKAGLCERHSVYNTTPFPDQMNFTYLSTLASILNFGGNKTYNQDTAFYDIAGYLKKYRKDVSRTPRAFNPAAGFYICIVEEYSMISPAAFAIVAKMICEISYSVIFILCGDRHQCKPINFNRPINQDPGNGDVGDRDFLIDALPEDCIGVARMIFGNHRVFTYTLTKLLRAADDPSLQDLITQMAQNATEPIDERQRRIGEFIKTNNINTNNRVDITEVVNDYVKLVDVLEVERKKLTNGNRLLIDNLDPGPLVSGAVARFQLPTKILIVSNQGCRDVIFNYIDTFYNGLLTRVDPEVLKHYITRYTVRVPNDATRHVRYLVVGFTYKVLMNMDRNREGAFNLSNGSLVKILRINYGKKPEHCLLEMVRSVHIEDVVRGNRYCIYPDSKVQDNHIKSEGGHQSIKHCAFPLQLDLCQNVFQSQGLTIECKGLLDCKGATQPLFYVMFSRFRTCPQIDAIINV